MSGDQEDPKNFAGMREPSDATPGYYWARLFEGGAFEVIRIGEGGYVYLADTRYADVPSLEDWDFGPRLKPPEEKSEDSP